MTIKLLDALGLASMDEAALIKRLAALWCREFQHRPPYNRSEIEKWVKSEFGPVVDRAKRERISKELLSEAKRQMRVRGRRSKRSLLVDPLTTPVGSDIRIGQLLNARLGPARRWVSKQRIPSESSWCDYMDGDFFSGLVAGLIPTKMRLRRIVDPNLLVYRQGQREPRTRFVPFHITTVVDAFHWLIPDEAREFLDLAGVRVEHHGENQAIRLITPWGVKALPWKDLVSLPTE